MNESVKMKEIEKERSRYSAVAFSVGGYAHRWANGTATFSVGVDTYGGREDVSWWQVGAKEGAIIGEFLFVTLPSVAHSTLRGKNVPTPIRYFYD